jgi:cytochrome c biogenesis protein CcdA
VFGPIERLRGGIGGSSLLATFSLGAVYGFAGFCSGPILGAILTVAATSGSALRGAGLLATYAAGMAAPPSSSWPSSGTASTWGADAG